MARINIEDEFFDDAASVAIKMGSLELAYGYALRLIRWAQLQVKDGKPMTFEDFERKGFSEHLFPEFGYRDGDLVCVRGVATHFAWLEKRREAGARGGRSKTEAKTKHLKQNRSKHLESVAKPKPTEPSFSSSISVSKKEKKRKEEEGEATALQPSTLDDVNLVQVYCDQWRTKTGRSPTIRPKEAGQLSQLGRDVGKTRAVDLIKAYFAMPNPYYLRRGYDVGTLLSDLSAVQQFEVTGKVVTGAVVHELEKRVDKVQGTGRRRSLMDLAPENETTLLQISGGDDDSAA